MSKQVPEPTLERTGSMSVRDSHRGSASHPPPSADLSSYLATVLASCDDAIVGKSLDGIIFSWNEGAERLYGHTSEAMIGQHISAIIPPDRKGELRRIMDAVRRRKSITRLETVRLRKDGRRVDVMLTVSPVIDVCGDVVGASSVARDLRRHRRAEMGEREALARLRAVVETALDGIITIDHSGLIETLNPAAVRLFGYTTKELVGRNVRVLMPEPYRSEHDSYMANYLATGVPKIIGVRREVRGRRKDGSVFPIELSVSETPLEDRKIFTGIVRDMTSRRLAEQALRESEARFRLMADSTPALIWMSGVDGTFTWLNLRWLEFTGGTLEQEIADGWVAAVHPEDRDRCVHTYRAAFDVREPFGMEYRLRRFDGTYRWVHNTGVPLHMEDGRFVGYIGSCTDVTEHKLGEDALLDRVAQRTNELSAANEQLQLQNEERRRIASLLAAENRMLELIATNADLDEVLENLCEAVERLIPKARCAIALASLNSTSKSQSNSSEPEAGRAPMTVFGAIAAEGIQPSLAARRTVVPRVSTTNGADERLHRHRIEAYWIEPIMAPGGAIAGSLGVYRTVAGRPDDDACAVMTMAARLAGIVVERARGEERAREQLAQLAHVARLATMGEMASGFAHELNQPLCAIVNFTEACVELINRDVQGRAELADALREVTGQAQRAGAVIRRLRDFVKRRAPERKSVDINKVVRAVVALTGVEARQNEIRVRMNLAKSLPKVFADSIQIEQVLVNLVRNALDAMRGTSASTRILSVETIRRRGVVEVTVSDYGSGIPKEIREQLFEPFFTTKDDGLGMGLSISRSILEMHEGKIWATPGRKAGTTFHFTLPTVWRSRHGRRNRIRRR